MKRGYLKRVMMILSIIITVGASAQLREFEDNFESGDLAKWSQTAASPVQWSVGTGVWQVSASEGSMYAYLYAVARQAPVKLVTSSLNLTSLKEPVLTFMMAAPKFSNGDRDTLKLYYRRNVESAWTHIESFVATTQNWTEQHLNLTSYVYPTVEFAFEYNYGAGKGIAIDNVLIGSTALCTRPVDLRAQRVTHSSATLSWSANSYSTQFNIKVSTTPMTDFTQTADVFDGTSGFQTRLVTGLSASTTYYFYVQADCEDGDISTWSQAGTFTTGCAAYALPYKETFGAVGIGTGVLPSCWNTIVRAFGDWGTSVPAADYTPHCQRLGTDTMLSMFVYYNSSSYGAVPRRTESYTILPALGTGSLTGYQLSFDMSSVGRAKLHVGVMLDPKDESTFVEITSIVSTGGPEERYFVPLNTAPADYNYLAFRVDASDYNEIEKIYIDDLDVSPLPSCIKPSILQASALTDSSAILTWAGVSPSYLLRVSSTSIDPATALSADIFDGEVTAASQNIASLSSHTPYYFYVQAKCGEGDETSEWSSEATFTTEATIASIPYSCDFEDADQNRQWLLQNGTQTNKWVIGTAAAQSGSGLYISANGTTNAYTNTAESYVYAIRTLNLDAAGYYAFQYSWKSVGELRDVLRVFLVPASIELFAGNHYGVVSTFTSGMTPENWIDIGDGIHYGSSSWTTKKVEYSLATPGKYNLVFLWANDKSAGSTPPAAIDNISVVKLTCTGIEDVTATYVTNSSATISWFDKDLDASAWNVKVSTTALSNPSAETGNIFDGQITVRPHIVSGLLPARTYYAYVQSSCGEGSVSSWQSVSFTTLCGAEPVPYTENFGATSFPPMCWERYSGLATTVFINGILSPVETGWSTKSGS
ncbi:MAG: choice-of-anchor J domain-containing protein, partial [Prevotellaceae bacterium]|nr:choice-of-anchor J domain-containing protein [Prevotellaceae bacterium]